MIIEHDGLGSSAAPVGVAIDTQSALLAAGSLRAFTSIVQPAYNAPGTA